MTTLKHPRTTDKTIAIIERTISEIFSGTKIVTKRIKEDGDEGIELYHGTKVLERLPLYDSLNTYSIPRLKSLVFNDEFVADIKEKIKKLSRPTRPREKATRSKCDTESAYELIMEEVSDFIKSTNLQAKYGIYSADVDAMISTRTPYKINITIRLRNNRSFHDKIEFDLDRRSPETFKKDIRNVINGYKSRHVL